MDVVIPLRHSQHEDEELRYVLRSLERNFTDLGKVWILGDRPEWLANDREIVEHVPHARLIRPFRLREPVQNGFLLTFLASCIPELSGEFLLIHDDHILLRPARLDFLRKPRAFEDLSKSKSRGQGLWKSALWRTYDSLLRKGYPALNYECHVPIVLHRRIVWRAYCEFLDFVSEDRYAGFLAKTAILNFQMKHSPFEPTWLLEEGAFIGIYRNALVGRANEGAVVEADSHSPTLLLVEQIRAMCAGKIFLNFDDESFSIAMHQFLDEEFPEPSRFEVSDL